MHVSSDQYQEATSGVIDMDHFPSGAIQCMIQYFYTGQYDVRSVTAPASTPAAEETSAVAEVAPATVGNASAAVEDAPVENASTAAGDAPPVPAAILFGEETSKTLSYS